MLLIFVVSIVFIRLEKKMNLLKKYVKKKEISMLL